jgi:hypothetical protein
VPKLCPPGNVADKQHIYNVAILGPLSNNPTVKPLAYIAVILVPRRSRLGFRIDMDEVLQPALSHEVVKSFTIFTRIQRNTKGGLVSPAIWISRSGSISFFGN